MKNKTLNITTIGLFLVVNTSYFWEEKLTYAAFPFWLLLLILFGFLVLALVIQVIRGIKEGFAQKGRSLTITIMALCLALIAAKPNGLINFAQMEGEDLFIAQREGAANCTITFRLKPGNRFVEKSVCFGVSAVRGTYTIKEDTIFFSDVEMSRGMDDYYEFAVLKKSRLSDEIALVRYENWDDTTGDELWIIEDHLLR